MIHPSTEASGSSEEAPRKNRGASFVDSSKQEQFYSLIGRRLRNARERAGLTQEETARLAGLDRAYLSQIETGRRRLSLYLAYRLSQTLGVTLDRLIESAGESDA